MLERLPDGFERFCDWIAFQNNSIDKRQALLRGARHGDERAVAFLQRKYNLRIFTSTEIDEINAIKKEIYNMIFWSISRDKFHEIQALQTKSVSLQPKQQPEKTFEAIGETAVISVTGVLTKRQTWLSNFYATSTYENMILQLESAMKDDSIKKVILDVDSPGGEVTGVTEMVDAVYQARQTKQIIAFSGGMIASAAYWIGSAANKLYIGNDTVVTGSIGVVASHRDFSGYEEQRGIKTTEVFAGKYKRVASQYKPLSDEGRDNIQGQVDYLYSVFVDSVARNRNTTPDRVAKTEGRVYIGRQAINEGLVDGMKSFNELFSVDSTSMSMSKPNNKEINTMGFHDERFEQIVKRLAKENNLKIGDAIRAAAAQFPEAHEDYIKRCKTNETDALSTF